MGKKQQAFINSVEVARGACEVQLGKITAAVEGIVELNKQLQALDGKPYSDELRDKRKKLALDKNPHFGELLKARNQLDKKLKPEFYTAVMALDVFAKKKSKRWFGKSTLKEAEKVVQEATGFKSLMDEIVAASVNIR